MSERERLLRSMSVLEGERNVLGDAVVDVLLQAARAKLESLDRSGALRHVTILLADVAGFTELSEAMDAEDVSALLNDLWRRLDPIVESLGGTVEKHVGDQLVAIWGAARATGDEPRRAVDAAWRMKLALESPPPEGPPPPRMRIVVHTGPVLVAPSGILGDALAAAERIESIAAPDQVTVSRATASLVEDRYELQGGPSVAGEATFVVRGPRLLDPAADVPLVGRRVELGSLEEALSRVVTERRARRLVVVGDPGSGRTRLLSELARVASARTEPPWILSARADDGMERSAFALLRTFLAASFEIRAEDTAGIAARKVMDGLAVLAGTPRPRSGQAGGGGAQRSAERLALLWTGPRSADEDVRTGTVQAALAAIAGVADTRAVLILVDDAELADDPSMELVRRLAELPAPVLVVLAGTPRLLERERPHAPAPTVLRIPPLLPSESEALLCHHLGGTEVPPATAQAILDRAEGSPLFLEAAARGVREGTIAGGAVPTSLAALVQVRLDRLPPDERRVLESAAVIGRTFWDAAVQALRPEEAPGAAAALRSLEERGIVARHGTSAFTGTTEMSFRLALLRDAAYASLPPRVRMDLHRRMAAWLLGRAGDRASELSVALAEHLDRGGDREAAAARYLEAGRWAYLANDIAQADLLLRRGHELASNGTLWRQIGSLMADNLRYLGREVEATEAFRSTMVSARAAGDLAIEGECLVGLAAILDRAGDHALALDMAGLAATKLSGDGRLEALHVQAWALHHLGRTAEARTLADEALSRATGDGQRCGCFNLLGALAEARGELAETRRYQELALEGYRIARSPLGEATMIHNLAETARLSGDHARALALSEEAIRRSKELHYSFVGRLALGTRGAALTPLQRPEEALQALDELLGDVPGPSFALPYVRGFRAEALLSLGRDPEAVVEASRALELAAKTGDAEPLANAWRILGNAASRAGEVLLPDGSSRDAPACFREAERAVTRMPLLRAAVLRDWGRHELLRGDGARGRLLWEEALDTYRSLGLSFLAAEMAAEAP